MSRYLTGPSSSILCAWADPGGPDPCWKITSGYRFPQKYGNVPTSSSNWTQASQGGFVWPSVKYVND